MREGRRSRWRKLDNAALAFPAATGKKDTRVFRFYCCLKEKVDAELLQQALERTVERYPLYLAVLRKGLFWFYLEHRELPAEVTQEDKPPCSKLYVPDQKRLLFEVSYYENRINFEIFHALSDGTGATRFLKELVQQYLQLAHPDVTFPETGEQLLTNRDQEEDSFSQYYSEKKTKNPERKRKAFQLPGPKLEQDEMEIMECRMSVQELLNYTRSRGVSITVFLSAVLLCAIHEEMTEHQAKKPVTLMIPINLRNYFPSRSMANFFGWLEAGYEFSAETTFDDVLLHVKERFAKELTKERVAERMNEFVRLEKNPFLRAVPLEIKNLFLLAGTTLGGRSITAVFSNMSAVRLPEAYENYIERFGVFTSTDKLQLCSCSFQDTMMLGFTSKVMSTNIQRNFIRILREQGLGVEVLEENFPAKKPEKNRKFPEFFTFACMAAAVVCVMLNYLVTSTLRWSIFAVAGCACIWAMVMLGYAKRRNLLKNSMWQLVSVSVLAILWDYFTGWSGWSLSYVLPCGTLMVLLSMMTIVRLQKLEQNEYLFYFVQAAGFGMIPFLLLVFGAVKVTEPSVVCSGISFLFLAGLALFHGKEFKQEFYKKFRM